MSTADDLRRAAELVELFSDRGALATDEYNALAARLLAAIPALEALERDARRYRWLISQHWIQSEMDWRLNLKQEGGVEYVAEVGAAIDAALAATEKGT